MSGLTRLVNGTRGSATSTGLGTGTRTDSDSEAKSDDSEGMEGICRACGRVIERKEEGKVQMEVACTEEARKKPWRKILYEQQPYDDNYVPDSFMSSAIVNANVQMHSYWNIFNETLNITHQLAAVALYYVVFIVVLRDELTSGELILIDALVFLCGFLLYAFLRVMDPAQSDAAELPPTEQEKEEMKPNSLDEETCYVPTCTPLKEPSNLSAFSSFWYRFRILSRVLVFIGVIHIFSPILKTLTLSFSKDTIAALSLLFLALHLFMFDYDAVSSIHPDFTGTISLNAALLTSVLLASRLQSTLHVFGFICFAFETFACLPIFLVLMRRVIGNGKLSWAFSLVFNGGAVVALNVISKTLAMVFFAIMMFVIFVCPAIIIYNQRYKSTIQGPWDYDDRKELDEL